MPGRRGERRGTPAGVSESWEDKVTLGHTLGLLSPDFLREDEKAGKSQPLSIVQEPCRTRGSAWGCPMSGERHIVEVRNTVQVPLPLP